MGHIPWWIMVAHEMCVTFLLNIFLAIVPISCCSAVLVLAPVENLCV